MIACFFNSRLWSLPSAGGAPRAGGVAVPQPGAGQGQAGPGRAARAPRRRQETSVVEPEA
jgi:hypothetical protein